MNISAIDWQRLLKRFNLGLGVAIIIGGLGVLLNDHNVVIIDTVDKHLGDLRTALLAPRAKHQRDDIAIVLITEDTLLDYPVRSPINGRLLAELISVIDAAGPKAIGLDFILERRTINTNLLLDAIHKAKSPIVIGAIDERLGEPAVVLKRHRQLLKEAHRPTGHILLSRTPTVLATGDSTIRFIAKPGTEAGKYSFADQLAKASGVTTLGQSRKIAWLRPPADGRSPLFMVREVPRHAPDEVQPGLPHIIPTHWPAAFAGKIVLIGGRLSGQDSHVTPLTILSGKAMPGVMIHAQALAQRLDGAKKATSRDVIWLDKKIEIAFAMLVAGLCFWLGRKLQLGHHEKLYQALGLVLIGVISLILFAYWRIELASGAFAFAWLFGALAGHYSNWIYQKFNV